MIAKLQTTSDNRLTLNRTVYHQLKRSSALFVLEGSRRSETQLRNHYIHRLCKLTRRVQCNHTLSQLSNLGWLPPGAVASC